MKYYNILLYKIMTHPSPFANRVPLRWILKSSKTILRLIQILFIVRYSGHKSTRLKRKPGGRRPTPLQTQHLYDGFWKGPYRFCLCSQDNIQNDLAQLKNPGCTSSKKRMPLRSVLKRSKKILCLVQILIIL